jgi:formylmethanofuran dehydrogenase subunit B
LGAAWFGDGQVPARVLIAGRDGAIDEALDVAASLLRGARRPLVYLAPELSCEAQREGVAIADALRGTVDSVTTSTAIGSVLAQQERGRASATLGEIRNRADVLMFWGVDPAIGYPRYLTRYAPTPAGVHVPNGRASRTVIAVDVGAQRGPEDADLRATVPAEHEVAALTAIRALVDRVPGSVPAASLLRPCSVPAATPWQLAAELAPLLLRGRYVVIVADGEPPADADPGRSGALIALAQALNGPTRAALSVLRAGGNRSGAEAVMTWQTGYPAAVDFSRGYPRYRPHDGGAAAGLARGRLDAALVLGQAAGIPADVVARLGRLPCAAIGPRASGGALAGADVVIDSAQPGVHESGMAVRMDDVPLPLKSPLAGPPAAAALAARLRERIVTRTG